MDRAVAVLVSGGLDSAVLCAELARKYSAVFPIYVYHGLPWETRELAALNEFFTALDESTIQPQVFLHLPVTDLYEGHWSMTGDIPGAETDDSAVYASRKKSFTPGQDKRVV